MIDRKLHVVSEDLHAAKHGNEEAFVRILKACESYVAQYHASELSNDEHHDIAGDALVHVLFNYEEMVDAGEDLLLELKRALERLKKRAKRHHARFVQRQHHVEGHEVPDHQCENHLDFLHELEQQKAVLSLVLSKMRPALSNLSEKHHDLIIHHYDLPFAPHNHDEPRFPSPNAHKQALYRARTAFRKELTRLLVASHEYDEFVRLEAVNHAKSL